MKHLLFYVVLALTAVLCNGTGTNPPPTTPPVIVPCYKVLTLGTTTPLPNINRMGESKLFTYGTTSSDSNCQDVVIQIDAGRGSLTRAKERDVDAEDIDALLVTHLHYDHTVGVADIVQTRAMNAGYQPTRRLRVVCPDDTVTMLNDTVNALKPDTTSRQVGLLGPFFKPGIDFTSFTLPTAASAVVTRVYPPLPPAAAVNSTDTDPITVDAIWVPHGGNAFKSYAYRINTPIGNVSFSGDLSMAPSGVNSQKFNLLANTSDVVVMNPYLSQLSPPTCKMNRVVNGANQTCIPANFPTIHSDSKLVGAFAKDQGIQTLILTHLNPSPGTWNVAPYLSDYERPVTGDDYVASIQAGGYKNLVIIADDYTTIARVNIRVASVWLYDTTHQLALVQLNDNAVISLAQYNNIGLTLHVRFGIGAELVQATEWSIDNCYAETDAVSPFCLTNHRFGDDKHWWWDWGWDWGDKDKDKDDDKELDCRDSGFRWRVGQTINVRVAGYFKNDKGTRFYGHPFHRTITINA